MPLELSDLVGPHTLDACARTDVTHPFDPHSSGIAWSMDGKVYMAFEDVNDGYRSECAPIFVAEGGFYEFCSPEYLNRQVVGKCVTKDEYGSEDDILELVDVETGHVWLRVGTEDIDDYYPAFVAEWHPMPPSDSQVKEEEDASTDPSIATNAAAASRELARLRDVIKKAHPLDDEADAIRLHREKMVLFDANTELECENRELRALRDDLWRQLNNNACEALEQHTPEFVEQVTPGPPGERKRRGT